MSLRTVASACHALVAEVNDAGPELPRFEQPQIDRMVQRREEWRAPSQNDRVNDRAELVYQAQSYEGRGKGGATHREILARLRFQPGDLIVDIAPYQATIPFDPVKRRGDDDLRFLLPDPGELDLVAGGRRIRIRRRPEVGHEFV